MLVAGDQPRGRWIGVACAVMLPLVVYGVGHQSGWINATVGPCLLRVTTGVPCLTCGATSAVVALTAGRVREAVTANPLVVVAIVGLQAWACWCVVATLWPPCRRRIHLTPAARRRAWWLIGAALAANWVWLAVH